MWPGVLSADNFVDKKIEGCSVERSEHVYAWHHSILTKSTSLCLP